MKNFHQPTKLLSDNRIEEIEKAFSLAWSKGSTYPDDRDKWSESNKALGQCAVTAVIIFDMFGGKLIYDKENFHIWNELPDGSQHDFSRSQFKDDRDFKIYKYQTKEEVLYNKHGKRTQAELRYKLLKQRLFDLLGEQK